MAKRTRPFHEAGNGEKPEQSVQAKKKKIHVEKKKSNNTGTILPTPKTEESVPGGETGVETWSKSKKKRMRMIKAKQQKSHSADFSNTSRNPTTTSSPTTIMIAGNHTSVDESAVVSKASKLQNEFKARLSGSRFRTLNEELYTTTSDESYERFSKNPELFEQYHEGFRTQVESWPVNPVDVIVRWLTSKYQKHKSPQTVVVADFGCGDAQLAKDLMRIPKRSEDGASSTSPFTVHSFDLVSQNELVTACDMANVPLPNKSVDVCVFCLSLMGTNLADFIREAHRVLKDDGKVKIAEVRSRIEYSHSKASTPTKKKNTTTTVDDDDNDNDHHNHHDSKDGNNNNKKKTKNAGTLNEFLDILKLLGFKCIRKDLSNKMFLLLELEKTGKAPDKTLAFSAKPCIYKRR